MNEKVKSADMVKAKCPECSKPVVHAYRPFCSKRCADLDLGKWFNEQYVLPGDSEINDDLEEN
ncbi:DNA gyrase inhibitor YacG [Kordiimonas aquimaris]|uniref:DNA gyrase inhibitor YacG n=1 Tax=Kordiimonas aquimaris TaxID=707591 RepID=UPI0021D0D031|nr:DNA gyrase inhibitor YacG [Kordiimonas aquimaris]